MPKKLLRDAGLCVILSPFLAAAVLAKTLPWHPHSKLGWILLFVIPAPAALLFGGLRQTVPLSTASCSVEVESQSSVPPWMRIGYFLILGLITSIFAVTFSL